MCDIDVAPDARPATCSDRRSSPSHRRADRRRNPTTSSHCGAASRPRRPALPRPTDAQRAVTGACAELVAVTSQVWPTKRTRAVDHAGRAARRGPRRAPPPIRRGRAGARARPARLARPCRSARSPAVPRRRRCRRSSSRRARRAPRSSRPSSRRAASMSRDPSRVGEAQRAGRADPAARRAASSMRAASGPRPSVKMSVSPSRQQTNARSRARCRGRPDVGERRHRVGEEHHPEPRHDPVERGARRGGEQVGGLRVGHDDGRRGHPPARGLDHRRRDVDADRLGAGRDRRLEQRARAAPDVEHPPRRAEVGRAHDRLGERRERRRRRSARCAPTPRPRHPVVPHRLVRHGRNVRPTGAPTAGPTRVRG